MRADVVIGPYIQVRGEVYVRKIYRRFGTIKRTIRQRPVLPVDWQALPPYGWCVCCGAEVFEREEERCARCSYSNGQWGAKGAPPGADKAT